MLPAAAASYLSSFTVTKSDLCTMIEAAITIAEDTKALDPLKAATPVISNKTSPTLSVIEPLHAQQLEQMRKPQHLCNQKPEDFLEVFRFLVYTVLVVLKHMLYVALALDPHFEALSFLSSEARDDKFSRLMMEAAALKQMKHLM